MLKIRLFQVGKKKKRSFRIVVMDARKKRNGRYIEKIGFYDPHNPKSLFKINHDRYNYWKKNGAQATRTVSSLAAKEQKGIQEESIQ